MNSRATRILASVALLLSASGSSIAADRHAQQIDALFRPLASDTGPGFSVLVIKDGHTIFSQGYGVADLRTGARITPQTNFRLASCTKQFTATAIMLLARDGKLSYDDPLTRFFPDFPAYGRSITIRELLSHTSGLPDYEDIYLAKFANRADADIPQLKDADILTIMQSQNTPAFPAGSKWQYSNSGFATLAMVVEKVSGKAFGEFLAQRIFKPLGMRNTIAFENGKNDVRNRAFGYRKQENGWTPADQSPTSAVLGDGGVYSSLDDLARWDRALARHSLLSRTEMESALTPVAVPGGAVLDGKAVQYGFGWFLDPYHGRVRMYHDGETCGFRTTIQRFVDERLTIIVLANRTDLDPDALALKVADVFTPATQGSSHEAGTQRKNSR
jgi:CubicO group peptidase (beta-lactamase class C family)